MGNNNKNTMSLVLPKRQRKGVLTETKGASSNVVLSSTPFYKFLEPKLFRASMRAKYSIHRVRFLKDVDVLPRISPVTHDLVIGDAHPLVWILRSDLFCILFIVRPCRSVLACAFNNIVSN